MVGAIHSLGRSGRILSGVWNRRDGPGLSTPTPECFFSFFFFFELHYPDQWNFARRFYLENDLERERKERVLGIGA